MNITLDWKELEVLSSFKNFTLRTNNFKSFYRMLGGGGLLYVYAVIVVEALDFYPFQIFGNFFLLKMPLILDGWMGVKRDSLVKKEKKWK